MKGDGRDGLDGSTSLTDFHRWFIISPVPCGGGGGGGGGKRRKVEQMVLFSCSDSHEYDRIAVVVLTYKHEFSWRNPAECTSTESGRRGNLHSAEHVALRRRRKG